MPRQGIWEFTFDVSIILATSRISGMSFLSFFYPKKCNLQRQYLLKSFKWETNHVSRTYLTAYLNAQCFLVLTCCQLIPVKEYCVFLFSKLLTVSFVDRSYLHALMPWYRLTIFWHANIGSHTKPINCSIHSNLGPMVVFQTYRLLLHLLHLI